jgi:hypothetical protein
MNPKTQLTPAELDALLTQPAATAATTEAAANSEAAALRSALDDLRTSSLAAADFRLPAPRPAAQPERAPRFAFHLAPHLAPRWAMACATAALAAAIAIPVALHQPPQSVANVPVKAPAATADPVAAGQTTEQDDALLADIQSDLSSDVPASLQPLATTSTSSTNSTK